MSAAADRELSVRALFGVHKWLFDLRTTVEAIRDDAKQPEAVRTIALHCSCTADRLRDLLKDTTVDTSHGARFIAQAIHLAAELAGEWHALVSHRAFEAPLTAHLATTYTGKANAAKSNAAKKAKADSDALSAFEAWKNHASRRRILAALTPTEQVKKYLKVAKPADRVRRRLRTMVNKSLIK